MTLACAVVVLGATFLPAADLSMPGFRGAGEAQRTADATARAALVPDALPAILPFLLAALVVAALAVVALRGFEPWWAYALVFGIAVGGVAAITVFVGGHLPSVLPPDASSHADGGSLGDKADLLRTRLRAGGYEPVSNAVELRPLAGLRIIQPVVLLMVIASGYRLLRLRLAPLATLAALAGGGALVYAVLLLAAIPPT